MDIYQSQIRYLFENDRPRKSSGVLLSCRWTSTSVMLCKFSSAVFISVEEAFHLIGDVVVDNFPYVR